MDSDVKPDAKPDLRIVPPVVVETPPRAGRGGIVPPGKKWVKGQSGNPSGRPVGTLGVIEAVRMILNGRTRCPRPKARESWEIAKAWIARAKENPTDLNLLLERLEGKVPQPMDHRHVVDVHRAITDAYERAQLREADGSLT